MSEVWQLSPSHRRDSGTPAEPPTAIRGFIIGGIAVTALLLAGTGLWAARTNIAGAVIASATVVVDSSVKKVQHLTGGIVAAIHVHEGDHVTAGDLLLTLDDTQTRASLQIITNQIDELDARLARLHAEQADRDAITFPKALLVRSANPTIRQIIDSEHAVFASRHLSLDGQGKQLRERIKQLDKEIDGLYAQRSAKAIEIELIDKELQSLSDLERRRLVTASKMIALRREGARLKGEHGQIEAGIAQAKGRIAEVETVILQHKQEFKKDVATEIREVQGRLAELKERRVAAEDQLAHIDIVAPGTGYVHQLLVHTLGGVVAAGEPIMLIVPDDDKLTLEARVAPRDREQVRLGATARIRFAAFNHRTTPEIDGTVKLIAADTTEDRRSGLAYYSVRIAISDSELDKVHGQELVPGLPADVQIRTQDRTALSYLIKPIEDQLAKAFRER